ncbi:MAG TPA: AI-2E family transporter [Terriglobales bacterium]|nr:AI-2E family transporter [Terriglobales bacterium]
MDTRAARILFTALLFALGLSFLYVARHTLIAFLFAILFAYLVDPAVSRIERWTRSRGMAIAAIYFLLVVLLGLFFFFVGPRIARQAQRLTEALPSLLDQVSSGNIAVTIGHEHGWNDFTIRQVGAFLASHRKGLVALAQRVGIRLAEAAKEAWLLLVIPILAIFFLKDGRSFGEAALSSIHSQPQREFLEGVRGDLNEMLAHFIRAQLTLAFFSFLVYSCFMGITKVPYALMLGTAGGLMEFIPLVGPLVAALLILLVALLAGYSHLLVLLIFLGAWRVVQDYVIAPRIMGKSMELHPLATLFGVLAGGEIAGVLGVYLSIPVMASLRIFFRRWRLYAEKRRFGPLDDYRLGADPVRDTPRLA